MLTIPGSSAKFCDGVSRRNFLKIGALGVGGGGGFMTGRGQANALTRATAILAALFFITSLALTVMANTGRQQKSIFEGVTPTGQAPGGNVLDQLKQIQDQRAPGDADGEE